MFVLLTHLSAIAQQEWVLAAVSDDTSYYISKTLRTRGTYIVAFEKQIPKNLNAERNRLIQLFEENKWNRYSYSVSTILVDIESYRTKSLEHAHYDYNGNVIDSWEAREDKWSYAKPKTVLEAVCETVEYLAQKRE